MLSVGLRLLTSETRAETQPPTATTATPAVLRTTTGRTTSSESATATSELTQPPERARQRRPSRDLFLEQAAVDAEAREQATASGYSDMRYSDAARKTADTLLDDGPARLRRRRHTSGELPTRQPTKMRSLDEDAQSEIQSEILDSIRGLKSEMHELRALVSEMHLRAK